MEKYENQGLVGEGSYGMVLKCKHKDTGQLVAIKKFLESEDDKMVKKIAMREVKMLKQLRHDNLVNLLDVFRRKKRLYLVFEFVDHTILDELEKCPNGLDETTCRKILWQVLKGIEFIHLNNIIHRDIKPENILVSKNGVVKLCDFGFARALAQPGEIYTDYVATRWYRAPELLVGDTKYGKAVDIWAVGCLLVEMLTGEPLFPGDSDIDQLYHIVKVFGNLTAKHKEVFLKNPLFVGMRLPEVREVIPLEKKFPRMAPHSLGLIKDCLRLDPDDRPTCSLLLKHEFFTWDGFAQKFAHDLRVKLTKEQDKNAMLTSIIQNKEDEKEKTDSDKAASKKNKKLPLVKKESKANAEQIKNTDSDQNKTHIKTESKDNNKTKDSKTDIELIKKTSTEQSKTNTKTDSKDINKTKDLKADIELTKKTDTEQNKVHIKTENKDNSKNISKEESKSTDDRSKCKLPDPTDKANIKKNSHVATVTLPNTDHKGKKDIIFQSLGNGHEKSMDKSSKTLDRKDKNDKQEREKLDKVQKSVNVGVNVHVKNNLEHTPRSEKNHEESIEVEKEKIKLEKICEKSEREREINVISDNKSDNIIERLKVADSKEECNKEKGDSKEKHEKSDKKTCDKDEHEDREKENIFSYKDSPTIPPIFPLGHNHQNTLNAITTIPFMSSPNMAWNNSSSPSFLHLVNNPAVNSPRATIGGQTGTLHFGTMPLSARTHQSSFNIGKPSPQGNNQVNDKMVKKQTNFKKTAPHHHSIMISPKLLQSEKSHLHDKSLEKLRIQRRESTMIDLRRDKELVTFPEVRGAEAAPLKFKIHVKHPQNMRSNVASIPQITHLDPFQSGNQMESHISEKSNENLPS